MSENLDPSLAGWMVLEQSVSVYLHFAPLLPRRPLQFASTFKAQEGGVFSCGASGLPVNRIHSQLGLRHWPTGSGQAQAQAPGGNVVRARARARAVQHIARKFLL